MEFSNKDFFSKYDQIRRKQWIWSHLPKNSLMENLFFCAVRDIKIRTRNNFLTDHGQNKRCAQA